MCGVYYKIFVIGENMKKIMTSAVLCAAMATAVSTFGVQPVSATYPLIDKKVVIPFLLNEM